MPPSATGSLRRPVFLLAVVVGALVVLAELGLSVLVGGHPATSLAGAPGDPAALGVPPDMFSASVASASSPPGSGIRALALFDGLVVFTLLLLGASVVVSQRAYARLQGVASLIVAIVWILACLALGALALGTLFLMIGLFVSPPFGTIVYLAVWGFFPVGDASVVLALLLVLKLVMLGLVVAAQPLFLRVKRLMALFAVSFVLQLVLGLIHGLLPRVVVSIGDQLWTLVTIVVSLVWAVVMLVMAIPAIVNAVRVSGSLAE